MSWEAVGVIVAIMGGIFSIIGNAVAITWSFAKLSAKLDNWIVIFSRFEDDYKEKRVLVDSRLDALFKRQDELKNKITILETQSNV